MRINFIQQITGSWSVPQIFATNMFLSVDIVVKCFQKVSPPFHERIEFLPVRAQSSVPNQTLYIQISTFCSHRDIEYYEGTFNLRKCLRWNNNITKYSFSNSCDFYFLLQQKTSLELKDWGWGDIEIFSKILSIYLRVWCIYRSCEMMLIIKLKHITVIGVELMLNKLLYMLICLNFLNAFFRMSGYVHVFTLHISSHIII